MAVPEKLEFEADFDRVMEVRVEMPGRAPVCLPVWLLTEDFDQWTVGQEKQRLLGPQGQPHLYSMAVNIDHRDPKIGDESSLEVMLDSEPMMRYEKNLQNGYILFQLIEQ
ncbi:hypothetical protein EGW08_006045 [Elysia chlorotica]|uniref:Uncharacterized protein n=1 Tax=Elysia chlorotica TaxID=188477 RepID=A0A3S1BE10_ELYCH|nr:hypothetical protein EGW08_006045 [Elysia chlorotica]